MITFEAMQGNTGMPGTTRDSVALAVELVEHLGRAPLPSGTAARLRGWEPLPPDWCAAIKNAFRTALASPRLTPAQRGQLEELMQQIEEAHPELAVDPSHVAGTTTSAPAPEESGRPPRRWLRVTTVVTVVIAIAAVSALAWSNYRTGQDWQSQALAARADVDRLVSANDDLEADLDEVGESLKRSEADVRLLERRLSRAADSKARAEDEREMARAYAERITEVAAAYDEVAQWFSACRQEQSTLTSMVFDFESYYYANQTYLVSGQVDAVAQACGTAESYLADLRQYVRALGE